MVAFSWILLSIFNEIDKGDKISWSMQICLHCLERIIFKECIKMSIFQDWDSSTRDAFSIFGIVSASLLALKLVVDIITGIKNYLLPGLFGSGNLVKKYGKWAGLSETFSISFKH